MVSERYRKLKPIIDYCRSCGVEVKTSTKARGHQGVFLHDSRDLKRIDISAKLSEDRLFPVVAHEFAHFFHHSLDKDFGGLDKIFGIKEDILLQELECVTDFVAVERVCDSAKGEKDKIKDEIKFYEDIIKKDYPSFKRSAKFVEFEKYIKHSEARFLLKYDRVKVFSWFKYVIYSIDKIKEDFPEMPEAFVAYINLRALQRRQRRLGGRLRKMKNYYAKHSELFARFVEALVVDKEKVQALAPNAYHAFVERLNYKSFKDLRGLLELIGLEVL